MTQAPILLIAFNRPDRLLRLIESLRPHTPEKIRVAIDGPRSSVPSDNEAIEATALAVQAIDWTDDVVVHRHSRNLGITEAIPWAVSWVLGEFTEAIIIEDDVTVGPQFLEFADLALELWADDPATFGISGYNIVPEDHLVYRDLPARYSQIVHSYAWATWRRAWSQFDPEMRWFSEQSVNSLKDHLGTYTAAIRWRQYAAHVRRQRVTTWDYQWAMSIWSRGGRIVMPNRNLIEYHGFTGGTHTTRGRSWAELPVCEVDLPRLHELAVSDSRDVAADLFVQRHGHRATAIGVALGYLEGPAMSALRLWRKIRP